MNKKSRIAIILGLLVYLLVSMTGLSYAQLPDIQDNWAEKQISEWLSQGLVEGYEDGTFKPNNSITRAEFITMVNKSFGFTAGAANNFLDVSSTDWFAGEIAKAAAAGYVSGYPDGTIKPNNKISRQEAASIIARLLQLDLSDNLNIVSEFKDGEDIQQWSKESVDAIAAKSIMVGYPDQTFRPAKDITRAEAIITLDRAVIASANTITYDKPGTYGPLTCTEIINGNVNISVAGVTLQNVNITGSLILAEGIGEGEVTLENVTVQRNTTINGGGAHSVVMENCTLPSLTVSKEGVRVAALENSSIIMVWLESGAILNGNFNTVYVAAKDANVEIADGTVSNLEVIGNATGANIYLAADAKIITLILNAIATITGNGEIDTAIINIPGSTIEPTITSESSETSGNDSGSNTDTGSGDGDNPLNFVGAFLTTVTDISSTTEEEVEGNSSVPVNPTIKLVFDRGVVRDYWDNNQGCVTMQNSNGTSVDADVFRIADVDAEKRHIFISPSTYLSNGETYDIIISPDLKANNGNTLNSEEVVTFTVESSGSGGSSHDTTPPTFADTYPKTVNVQLTQFDLLVKCNEAGNAYFVVLPNDAAVPSSAQVKAGQDAGGNSLVDAFKGNVALTANTEASIAISGLTVSTDYDIYVVAEDNDTNLQVNPVKVEVRTNDPDPGDLSEAGAALAVAGTKTAGATFDLNITGAKDSSGASLNGSIAVTVTSDLDGQVFSGNVDFVDGNGTLTIAAGEVTTAGTNILTLAITGVTTQPQVPVTVLAASQISSANSTVTIDQALAEGATSVLTVTLRDAYDNPMANITKNLKIAVTVTNADATTAESYTVDGTAVTITTTLSRADAATDANGQIQYSVTLPGTIDIGDGLEIQITQNNDTPIGSAFSFVAQEDLSEAGAALAVAGTKTAGATFDLNITGAKDSSGASLNGSIAVTVTSDLDGQVFSGNVDFVDGNGTLTIAAGEVTTAGTNILTLAITGVTTQPQVPVTVLAASQISSANSTVTIDQALAEGATSVLTVTLRDAYDNPMANITKNLKIAVTVTNADATTAESYTVDGTAVTITTTLSRADAATDANGQIQYSVTLPGTIDIGDGLEIQITQNNDTPIGSAFSFVAQEDLSEAGVALAVAGTKTAGATFDLNITGAKDSSGASLNGSIAVTVTSDLDGQVFSGNVDFVDGNGTLTIAAGEVITAGTNILTLAITGVTTQPQVPVTVLAASQISSANSTVIIDQALSEGATSVLTVTLRDAYDNPMANITKNLKIAVTVTNADATTAESYTVDGTAVTITTTLSRADAATDANGQIQYSVTLPGTIDIGDGLEIQITQNNDTPIGSAFSYVKI
ncbi:S-layer homology domain-containing protein [Phosphitispora sp. TUW77]|uniref:S-layer homology domain-containing protein n=1 Tax=Phosphitispora sp. TUW77 TaxID=3152361 RepID=UPI003AB2C1F7